MKKILLSVLSVLISFSASAESVDLNDVTRIALANSLDIQILNTRIEERETLIRLEEGIYDTHLEGGIGFSKSRSQATSIFAPTKSETLDFSTAVNKRIPYGSLIRTEFSSDRDESDSIFVSPNPSYDMMTRASVTQSVGRNFFGLIDRERLSRVAIDSSRYRNDQMRLIELHIASVRKAYYRAVEAGKLLIIEQKGLEDAVEFDRVSEEKLRIGMLEKPDKFAAEASVKRHEVQVLLQKNIYHDELNQLKTELRIPIQEDLKAADVSVNEEMLQKLDEAYDVQMRYDWLALQKKTEAAEIDVTIARSNLMPEATLDAAVDWSGLNRDKGTAADDAFRNRFVAYNVAFNVDWNVENNSAQSELQKSRYLKHIAMLELKRLENEIELEFDAALRDMKDAKSSVEIAESILSLERKKLESEMKRFNQGRSNTDTIIRYQNDVLSAQSSLEKQITGYHSAIDDVMLAGGILIRAYESSGDEDR